MFQQDYLMRQILMLTQFLAKLLFGKDDPTYTVQSEGEATDADSLYLRLCGMAANGELNEAEDLLFGSLQTDNLAYLEVALGFYTRLNALTDSELDAHNYSREEIEQGLRAAAAKFGVELP